MSTIINGDSPSITFSDGSTQSKGISSVNPVFTGDASISGLTVGKGGGADQYNTALGLGVLGANTTGGSQNVGVGWNALQNNTTGTNNVAVGMQALKTNTTASDNSALGLRALQGNTTGASNTAIGSQSLYNNTTASNNTAVGYQAGYTNATGAFNAYFGRYAGYLATGGQNTFIGDSSGYNSTGTLNSYLGSGAGVLMTTGSKNTIVGAYSGNTGGLDIRTASNNIVLSDGDGNPSAYTIANGAWYFNSVSAGTNSSVVLSRGGTARWWMWNNNANNNIYVQQNNFTNGVTMSDTATAWSSASDSRLKNIVGSYTHALADISQIEPVKFTWKSDAENKPQVGVIAQSVQKVVPEAVDSMALSPTDTTEYLTVRYTELIPLMIASIQELKAELDATKAEVALLKAK